MTKVVTIITVVGRVIRHSRKYVIVISPGDSKRLRGLAGSGKVLIEVLGIPMNVHVGVLGERLVLYLPTALNPVWEKMHGRSVEVSLHT